MSLSQGSRLGAYEILGTVGSGGMGEVYRAFELLQEAVRSGNCRIGIPRIRLFDGFRKDPRFVEHPRRIGHPDIPDAG